jgi:hypothetical protein
VRIEAKTVKLKTNFSNHADNHLGRANRPLLLEKEES